ncbi:MAG TPA: RNA 2',3'-cyclic phosphodiesterase [Anaerolineae bacterium]|nr:RNA 2',3'-cyclic phosphodiesterase [Anaerolineae bacterium]
MDAIRAFIAIELPETILAELDNIEARLKPQMPDDTIRWVKADSIHLTLKFLGQVPSDQLGLITSSLRTAVAAYAPFTLEVKEAGCFPNIHRPRVVWVGVQDNSHRLHTLQRTVENAIAPLGYPTEIRDFTPHLTLGRLARDVRPADQKRIGEVVEAARVGSLGKWEVTQVALIRSDLKPSGAEYMVLTHAPLSGK